MNNREFSDGFTTKMSSYAYQANFGNQTSDYDLAFDEYEKSVFLTGAQEELVIDLYSGRDKGDFYGLSFENTEELRRYLDGLVTTKEFDISEQVTDTPVDDNSIFFHLPDNLAFITLEQIVYSDDVPCFGGQRANVYPVKQDEFSRVRKNPFRGATDYKAIRLDSGTKNVELLTKHAIKKYIIRYLQKPTPIVLEDLPADLSINGVNVETPCELHPLLHEVILENAIRKAAYSRGLKINNNKQ